MGGERPPHNVHKWRVGPPLLCLGRKGRGHGAAPSMAALCLSPPRPLGRPLGVSPLQLPLPGWGSAVSPARLWSFWGPLMPSDTPGGAEGVSEGLIFGGSKLNCPMGALSLCGVKMGAGASEG